MEGRQAGKMGIEMDGINKAAERQTVCLMSVNKHGRSLTLQGGCVSAGMTDVSVCKIINGLSQWSNTKI